jgi:hypothetical protein
MGVMESVGKRWQASAGDENAGKRLVVMRAIDKWRFLKALAFGLALKA